MRPWLVFLSSAGAGLLTSGSCFGGRPLITDDASVATAGALQIETWIKLDRELVTQTATFAYGMFDRLELAAAGVQGLDWESASYTWSAPTLQLKTLFWAPKPGGYPGLAGSLGGSIPWGTGPLSSDAWSSYGYLATSLPLGSESPFELDANAGFARALSPERYTAFTWGAALLVSVPCDACAVFIEVNSGIVETKELDGLVHAGFKYLFSEHAQLDASVGDGIWGHRRQEPFATVGFVLLFGP